MFVQLMLVYDDEDDDGTDGDDGGCNSCGDCDGDGCDGDGNFVDNLLPFALFPSSTDLIEVVVIVLDLFSSLVSTVAICVASFSVFVFLIADDDDDGDADGADVVVIEPFLMDKLCAVRSSVFAISDFANSFFSDPEDFNNVIVCPISLPSFVIM